MSSSSSDQPVTVFSATFDDCPGREGQVFLRELEYGEYELVLKTQSEVKEDSVQSRELVLFRFSRDQWGVYISPRDSMSVVAQEDGTRSFLDGLIRALQDARAHLEFETTPATITTKEST